MGFVDNEGSGHTREIAAHVPQAKRALAALTRAGAPLDHRLAELIKVRVSQINGCAYCVDLHVAALRDAGEHPRRIDLVATWRSAALFSPAERAALALAEGLTRLPDRPADEQLWAHAAAHWSEEELALIVMTTIAINAWNRYMIATGVPEPPLGER